MVKLPVMVRAQGDQIVEAVYLRQLGVVGEGGYVSDVANLSVYRVSAHKTGHRLTATDVDTPGDFADLVSAKSGVFPYVGHLSFGSCEQLLF